MSKLKFSALATVATAGLLAFGASSANAILLDNFSNDQSEIQDILGGGATPSGTVTVTTAAPYATDISNNSRQLFVETTAALPGGTHTSMQVSAGQLIYSQDDGIQGTGTVEWTFDATSFGNPITMVIEVIGSDSSLADVTLTLFEGAGFTGTSASAVFDIPEVDPFNDPPQTVSRQLAPLGLGDVLSARLFIDGSAINALDLRIDFIESRIPEAATLGIFGLGLIGLGAAVRRRKTA